MRILVISGYSPNKNSSANLSHNAFIEGFIQLGYKVDILCHTFDNKTHKEENDYPRFNNVYSYDGLSLYEKISKSKKEPSNRSVTVVKSEPNKDKSTKRNKIVKRIKSIIRLSYGPYNPSVVWYYRARKFKSNAQYKYVVSMGYPHISHRVAAFLIKHKRINTEKWIQLWEDPWYYSLELKGKEPRVKKAEYKLLDAAWDVVYVSPITLKNQQRIFERNKEKMRWCPLATYYQSNESSMCFTENHYGYFGDYFPYARNLEPFYRVAVEKNLNVDICGSPSDLFSPKGRINIYPRLSTIDLKTHENKTNVVVCLFNLGGGQIPGKIYQLAATNKTILAILDGPEDEQLIIRDYFEKFNRFVFCQNNKQSISEAIDRIENNDLGCIISKPINEFSVTKSAKRLLGE